MTDLLKEATPETLRAMAMAFVEGAMTPADDAGNRQCFYCFHYNGGHDEDHCPVPIIARLLEIERAAEEQREQLASLLRRGQAFARESHASARWSTEVNAALRRLVGA